MEAKKLISVIVGLLVVGIVAGFTIPLLNQAPSATSAGGPFRSNSALDNATGNSGMLTAIFSIFGIFVLIALLLMAVKVLSGGKGR